MPKKKPKLRKDENELAFDIVRAITGEGPRPTPPGEGEKNPEAVRRGSKGGKKGGPSRAAKLSPEEREEAARVAAQARWKKGSAPQHHEVFVLKLNEVCIGGLSWWMAL